MHTFSLALLCNFALVWVGLIRATDSAVPSPAQLQQKETVKEFVVELSLSPQNSYKNRRVHLFRAYTSTIGVLQLLFDWRLFHCGAYHNWHSSATSAKFYICRLRKISRDRLNADIGGDYSYDIVAQATGVNLKFYQQVYAGYVEIASAMLNTTGAVMSFVIQPITKNAVLQSLKRGGNPIGFRAQEQQRTVTFVSLNLLLLIVVQFSIRRNY